MTQLAPGTRPEAVHGLVPALTSFVGREAAIREVAELLGEYRLVTVTGPGGVGKTRLACEVARRVADRFADGVWLTELARVHDPALVPAVVAVTLGVRETPAARLMDSLAAALSRRQLLLILDNCEHVLAAAAELCAKLLPFADDVRILTTSREPIRPTVRPAAARPLNRSCSRRAAHTAISTGSRPTMMAAIEPFAWLMPR